jgi:hypothetical protein
VGKEKDAFRWSWAIGEWLGGPGGKGALEEGAETG